MVRRFLRSLLRSKPSPSWLLNRQAHKWSRLGEAAPYWSVLTGCSKTPTISDADRQEFYRSGADEIQVLNDYFAAVGHAVPSGRCLDWGCGLGRVLIHLAAHCQEAVGVDISRPHLTIARTYADGLRPEIFRRIVLCHALDDEAVISRLSGQVDLVHSILVLQHMPPPLMIETLTTFARLMSRGGYAFFQIPTSGENYNYADFDLEQNDDLEMHALPVEEIQVIFRRHACRQLAMIEKDRTGPNFVSQYFLFQKD